MHSLEIIESRFNKYVESILPSGYRPPQKMVEISKEPEGPNYRIRLFYPPYLKHTHDLPYGALIPLDTWVDSLGRESIHAFPDGDYTVCVIRPERIHDYSSMIP